MIYGRSMHGSWYTRVRWKWKVSYLREGRTLSPDRAIMADDGSGGEVLASAIDVAHQMIIDVSLPRHFLFVTLFSSSCGACVVFCVCELSCIVLNKDWNWIMDEGWYPLHRPFTSTQLLPPIEVRLHFRTQLSLFSYSFSFLSRNRLEMVRLVHKQELLFGCYIYHYHLPIWLVCIQNNLYISI